MAKDPVVYTPTEPLVLMGKDGKTEAFRAETITLRWPKAKDMRVLDREAGEVGRALALIASLADIPIQAVDELSAEDVTALSAILEGFFPGGLPTGPMSSET